MHTGPGLISALKGVQLWLLLPNGEGAGTPIRSELHGLSMRVSALDGEGVSQTEILIKLTHSSVAQRLLLTAIKLNATSVEESFS